MKTWRYYDVLIRGRGGFWTPDDLVGAQERYESPEAARERAAYLYSNCGQPEVQVRERTETIIAVWPEES